MKTRPGVAALFAMLFLVAGVTCATASITFPNIPYTFADNAFADDGWPTGGSPWDVVSAPSFKAAVTGTELASYVWSNTAFYGGQTAYATIAFIDNRVKNGPGVDLAVFEVSGYGGTGCTITLSLNGVTRDYTPSWFTDVYHVAYVDLSDFNIAPNALVSEIGILSLPYYDPDYTAFGAINNAAVPLPGTLLLLAPALGAIGLGRKRFLKK